LITLAALAILASWAPSGFGADSTVPSAQITPTATREPPSGTWRALHGPRQDPLWRANPPALRAVHGILDGEGRWIGWAVGDDGALAHFDGESWEAVDALESGGSGGRILNLRDVFVIGPEEAWIVGQMDGDRSCLGCGVVIHYFEQRWRILDRNEFKVNGRVAPLNAIDMIQDDEGKWHGWAVGDDADFDNIKAIILHHYDGEWRVWTGSNNIAKHLYDVKILSPKEAWAVGEGGAESWYMEDEQGTGGWPRLAHSGPDTLYAVDLADRLEGWDGGVGGRMNHYQGGCHDETLETQCWFNNGDRPIRDQRGSKLPINIYDVDVLSRTEGWLVAEAYVRRSVVAYLDGKLWRVVDVEDDPGVTLYGLFMRDSRKGFAVGADGVILEYVDETDPTPPPTPTATETARPSPSATTTPTASATVPSPGVPTATPSPTVTASSTFTPTPSPTALPSVTPPPTATLHVEPPTVICLPLVMSGR